MLTGPSTPLCFLFAYFWLGLGTKTCYLDLERRFMILQVSQNREKYSLV